MKSTHNVHKMMQTSLTMDIKVDVPIFPACTGALLRGGGNSSPKTPKIRHCCRHYEQYSAARARCSDVIPSKTFWLLTSLLTTALGYGFSEAVLFLAKQAPNSVDESSEDREVDNSLEKYILLTL